MIQLFAKATVLIALILFAACQQAVDIEDFDEAAFRNDPDACQGQREAMREQVLRLPQALQGLTQQKVEATLGKADRQELYRRSQKYLIYYIEPGPRCEQGVEEPFTMRVRFNSVGQANEISFENF